MSPILFCRLCGSSIEDGRCTTCRSTVGQGKVKAALFDLHIHMDEIDRIDHGALKVLVRQLDERGVSQSSSEGE